jgi:type IV fimbrial biogenesis protein FimT
MKNHNGFTLLELIVTISIAGILMALAIPSFSDMIRGSRLTTTINELVGSLNLARSEAVKRGTTVIVKAKTGTNWESGWTVELPAPCTINCVLRDYAALTTGYTLRGNIGNSLDYKSSGASEEAGYLTLCTDGAVKSGYIKVLNLNFIGRINVAKDTNNNGIPDTNGVDVATCT